MCIANRVFERCREFQEARPGVCSGTGLWFRRRPRPEWRPGRICEPTFSCSCNCNCTEGGRCEGRSRKGQGGGRQSRSRKGGRKAGNSRRSGCCFGCCGPSTGARGSAPAALRICSGYGVGCCDPATGACSGTRAALCSSTGTSGCACACAALDACSRVFRRQSVDFGSCKSGLSSRLRHHLPVCAHEQLFRLAGEAQKK